MTMAQKRFELRTAEYVLHDIYGDKFVVKNYKREVKSVADVYGFVFQDEWAEEPWLDETSWYLTYGGKVLWDVKTFLARGKLLSEDGIDTREMSLFDFVDQRVKVSERKGSLILNRLTREFTGPDIPSNEDVVLQYHGLAAYSGSTGFSEKLATCLSKAVVICGSDRALGPVGIVFEGPVFKAHDKDIWSTRQGREVVRRIPSVTEEDFLEMSEMLIGQYQYIETFTQVREVFGIWCDPNCPLDVQEEAANLAKEYNLEIFWGIPKRLGKPEAEKEFFAGLVKVTGE
mgnify:FL=1